MSPLEGKRKKSGVNPVNIPLPGKHHKGTCRISNFKRRHTHEEILSKKRQRNQSSNPNFGDYMRNAASVGVNAATGIGKTNTCP